VTINSESNLSSDLPGAKQQRQAFRLLPPRKVRAIMFGDFHGFGRLNDRQMLTFYDHVMDRLASVLDKYASEIVTRNTWGDGLFLVFGDLGRAARCALELQSELAHSIYIRSDYLQASACDSDWMLAPYLKFEIRSSRQLRLRGVTSTAQLDLNPTLHLGRFTSRRPSPRSLLCSNTAI
jgi:hypothetical protein